MVKAVCIANITSTALSGSNMNEPRIQKWKDVAALLKQGWRVDGFDLESPAGERRNAWGNAIKACHDRGLFSRPTPAKSPVVEASIRSVLFPDDTE